MTSLLDIAAICLTLTAVLAYLNVRFVKLPPAIGVIVIALLLSLGIVGLDALGIDHGLRERQAAWLRSLDFSDVLLQGMLSLLLFAGALHVDVRALRTYRWQVGGLALVGTMASTFAIGFRLYAMLPWVGLALRWCTAC